MVKRSRIFQTPQLVLAVITFVDNTRDTLHALLGWYPLLQRFYIHLGQELPYCFQFAQ